ncbi:unnamed protein product (macronuclear) [Paramecium tetraurelia]|uniref:Uncharacterized protein n=1 Tax=Paramecium tetraurelia TaxID=5888 RepID=A0CR90_PARTE|nr:uncharacterized protein GSPATT00009622001 [Paramecium tetraurelia]CAK73307.1 unnamed protein product [Paramecium tetraurelia]|eukprot:XP_001440704.1 hypothetical protein (macronuclear) [Paramecium tetraurelia strain d4-2]
MPPKKKQQQEVVEFTEAEKKALEKLDHSNLLIDIQVLKDRIEELQKKVYDLNETIRTINEQNVKNLSVQQSSLQLSRWNQISTEKKVIIMLFYSNMTT